MALVGVTQEQIKHKCRVGWEEYEVRDDPPFPDGTYLRRVDAWEGDIRACDTCEKLWIAERVYRNILIPEWRPMTWWECRKFRKGKL